MIKLLFNIILVCYLFVSPLIGQKIIWKIDKSQYVQLDSNYNVSLLLSNKLSLYPKVKLYVLVDEGVNLLSSELKTREWTKPLTIERTSYPGYYGKSYQILLPLFSEYKDLSANSNLLLELNAPFIKSTEIAYAIELTDNRGIKSRISSFETSGDNDYLPVTRLEFFTEEKKDNESLVLKSKSTFEISPEVSTLESDMLYSFWCSIGKNKNFFINLVDNELQDSLLQLYVEPDGYINIPTENIFVDLENRFVGKSGWAHFSILLNSIQNTIDVYLNGRLAYSIPSNNIDSKNLNLSFDNRGAQEIKIDNILIMDFGNAPSSIKRNMNYSRFISDSSKIIYSLNFENESDLKDPSDKVISYKFENEPPAIENANPPLFSRMPEIEFKSFESFSEIIWRNPDDLSVQSYSLEKSLNGSRYFNVLTKDSDNDPNKYYSIIDEKNNEDEIVYYRIRQLNKDGSKLYSAILKVGQAVTQSFALEQNYPNPFNPLTTITIEVVYDSEFYLVVYDLVGNEISQIHSGYLSKGLHKFQFDGTDLPSGIYFMEASSKYSTQAIKMILAK